MDNLSNLRTWFQGDYRVEEEYFPGEALYSVRHYRDDRLLESAHTANPSTADSIWWQFIDESKTAICRRRWS